LAQGSRVAATMVSLMSTPRQDVKLSPKDRRPTSTPVNIHEQKDWHHEFRDLTRNQYRTCYHDMILSREVAVKSTKPSGYGGHVANVGADVLYKNTLFGETQEALKNDEHRQRLPDFEYQLAGLPVHTMNPRGARFYKTAKTLPKGRVIPPWAVEDTDNPLSYRKNVDHLLAQLATPRYLPIKPPYEEFGSTDAAPLARTQTPRAAAAEDEVKLSVAPKKVAIQGASAPAAAPAAPAEPTEQRAFTPRAVNRVMATTAATDPPSLEESAQRAHYIAQTKASYVLNDGSRTPRGMAATATGFMSKSGAMTAR